MTDNFDDDFKKASNAAIKGTVKKITDNLHFAKFGEDEYKLYGNISPEIRKIATTNDGIDDPLSIKTILGSISSSVSFMSFTIDDDDASELVKKFTELTKKTHKSKTVAPPPSRQPAPAPSRAPREPTLTPSRAPPPSKTKPHSKALPTQKSGINKPYYAGTLLLLNGPAKCDELIELGGVYLAKKKYWVFPPSVTSDAIEDVLSDIVIDSEFEGGAQIVEHDEYKYYKYMNKYLSLLKKMQSSTFQ